MRNPKIKKKKEKLRNILTRVTPISGDYAPVAVIRDNHVTYLNTYD